MNIQCILAYSHSFVFYKFLLFFLLLIEYQHAAVQRIVCALYLCAVYCNVNVLLVFIAF